MLVKRSSMLPENGPSARDLAGLSTPELIDLARSGDLGVFDPLYRRFAGRLLNCALYRLRGNEAQAQDAVSETWLCAMSGIGTWVPRGGQIEDDLARWLFGILRYRIANIRSGRWQETPTNDPGRDDLQYAGLLVHGDQAADDETTDQEKAELAARLREAIDGLSVEQQTVVRMRLDGDELPQIAQATGWEYERVLRLWKAAQTRLRTRLLDDQELFADPAAVRQAAQRLASPIQRRVALMRIDGAGLRDIAQATGLSLVAVGNAWNNARNNLRRYLSGAAPLPSRREVSADDAARLREAARSLPDKQRQVALMRIAGMRERDIIRATGRTQRAVACAWAAARRSLTRHGLPVTA